MAIANEFLTQIGSDKVQEAYDSTAFAFQAGQTFRSFQASVKDLGLTQTSQVRWKQPESKDKEVDLAGDVVVGTGKTLPVTLKLIEERGQWRVFGLVTPKPDDPSRKTQFSLVGKGAAFNAADNHEVPAPAVLQRLVEESLIQFNEAIQKKNFEDFYNYVSLAWQGQLTPKRLQSAFQPFIDNAVNVGSVRSLIPTFDSPPEVNSEGLLILSGHYQSNPYKIYFDLRFTYEFPHWKLFGVDVQLRQ